MNKISIVIPTYNEQDNIAVLLFQISEALRDKYEYDVLVVDDGKDKTSEIAISNGARVVKGQHKGLGQAIIDGIYAAETPVVVVMDADLSHRPQDIVRLIAPLFDGYDMIIGSRYTKDGGIENWALPRRIISRCACLMALPVTTVKDSTSGFFAIKKDILENVKLNGSSWKTMLEILIKAKPLRVMEVPIMFSERHAGKSKFNKKQMLAYIKHLILLARFKYKRITKFAIVGGTGAIFHLTLLYTLTDLVGINYIISAIIAAVIAATVNYTVNHFWAFERTKIRGNWFLGWLKYEAIDGISDLFYIGQLTLFVEVFGMWYMFAAVLATIINYPLKYFIFRRFIWDTTNNMKTSDKDYEWEAFYKGGVVQKWWKHQIANTVWKWIPNSSALLDIGCGSSPIIGHYENAVGLDQNIEKLKFMQDKYPNKTFSTNDLSNYGNGSFDYVLCIEVIEHVENPALLVKEISRVLKTGGKAIIATPDYNKTLWHMAEAFTPYKEDHHNNFTMDKLDRLCEKFNLMPTIYKYVAGCDLVEMFVKCPYEN